MFYRVEASRVTLREFWFETKVLFWLGIIVKLMKIRIRGSTDDLAVESLEPFAADPANIPPERTARFTRTIEQLQALGFEGPIWLDEEDPYQATRNTIATLRHSSGKAIARIQCRTNFGRHPAKTKFFTSIISETPAKFIVTGNGKYDMAWPKSHDTVRFRSMPVADVWAEHLRRMTPDVATISPSDVREVEEAYHISLRDFHLKRGVFEPLSDEELETYLAPSRTAAPAVVIPPPPAAVGEDEGLTYAPVAGAAPPAPPLAPPDMLELATLDEIRQIQNKKINSRSTLLLLVFSGVLFVLFTRGSDHQTDWQYMAIIVGVLLFHELGHFLAMKLFRYRNLRMFFIPGLGAAVTGRNYNAPAWKKIIVSLMGPMPGVVGGAVMMFAGDHWHHEIIYRIGLIAILINVFNLIPLLPFDGGWVAHAALFTRHPKLDIGFRLAAALILLAAGIFIPGFKFLPYLAIATLVTLPLSYRQATIVSELRRVAGLGISPDSQTIPIDTARIIFARLRERFPRGLTAKSAAQQVASIFEALNAKPPSVGATLGLLSLHGGTFIVGIVAAVVAIVLHNRNMLWNAMARGPKATVTAQQIASSGPTPAGARNTLVVTFKTPAEAFAALGQIESSRPAMQFGQTLLVDFLPSEAERQRAVFDKFQSGAEDLFVESEKTHAMVEIQLRMPTTDDATATFAALEHYLPYARWQLAPPWAGEDVWPAAKRHDAEAARTLLASLQRPAMIDSTLQTKLADQMEGADKRGDEAEVARLERQMNAAQEEASAKQAESLRQQFGHDELINNWQKIQRSKDYRGRRDQMKEKLGPLLGPWPADASTDLLARSGYASNSSILGSPRIDVEFNHCDTGLIAMTRWLFAHGAQDVHYEIYKRRASYGDDSSQDDEE